MPRARPGAVGGSAGGPPVVAVVGASGGAGASTLVAALGSAASRRGLSGVVVDLQPGGAGLDLVCGVDHVAGLRWSDLLDVEGAVDGAAVGLQLPSVAGFAVLSHARQAGAVPGAQVVAAVLHGLAEVFDVVALDVCRGGVGQLEGLAGLLGAAVVLARVGVVEVAAAAATVDAVTTMVGPPAVWLRGPRHRRRVCREVATELGLTDVEWLADDPSVARDVLAGRPPGRRRGALSAAADTLLDRLACSPRRASVAS